MFVSFRFGRHRVPIRVFVLVASLVVGSLRLASAQVSTLGFLNQDRPELPGTLLSHPLANDSEATGRTTSISYLNGWIVVGAEAPGSRPGSDLEMRVYDISDPTHPLRRFPSDFGLVYPNDRWHQGNAGWNAHGSAFDGNFLLPEVMQVSSFGGIPQRGNFDIPNGVPSITQFPIGYNRSSQAGPWLASFPWYQAPDEEFYIGRAQLGPNGFVQFQDLAHFDHVGEFGGGDWHPMFFGDLLIYARSGATGHDGIVVYRLRYDNFDDPQNRSITPQFVGSLPGGFHGYWPNLFSDGTGLYVVGSETNLLMAADISQAADPAGDGSMNVVASMTVPGFTNASYPVYQDQFGFIHNRKLDMTRFLAGDPNPIVLTLNEGAPNFADTTQMSLPLGNLWITGGYPHGYGTSEYLAQGMSVWVHDQSHDSTRPRVSYHIPQANRVNYPRFAPLSFLLHEHGRSGGPRNGVDFTVRPVLPDDSLGSPVAGFLIHDFSGTLTFTADGGLAAATTYQVDFLADPDNAVGFRDAAGNYIEPYTFRFSTGDGINASTPPAISAVTADVYQPAPGQSVTVSTMASGEGPLQYRFNFDGSWSGWSSDSFAIGSFTSTGRPRVLVQVRDGVGNLANGSLRLLVVDPPSAGPRPAQSSSLAVGDDGGQRHLWVVNPDADTVSVLDADTGTKLSEHSVCNDPRGIARDANGRYWVTCHDSDEIRILNSDGSTFTNLSLAYGSAPFAVVAAPDGQTVFVSMFGSGRVHRYNALDPSSPPAVREVFSTPRAMAISADGTRLFVTRFISSELQGEVAELAGASPGFEWVRTMVLASSNTIDGGDRASGVPNYLAGIALSPDGHRAAIASKQDNTLRGLAFGVTDLTHETTVRAVVSFLDLDANQEIRNSRRDFDNSDSPSAVAFTPLGDTLLVALQGNNSVVGVDMLNLTPVVAPELVGSTETSPAVISLELGVGLAPQGLILDAVANRLFVQNFLGRSVSVREAGPLLLENRTTLPEIVTTTTVTNELLAPAVLAGKRIFYNAADPRMSADSYISCATCHIDGGHDGRVWDFTGRGEGFRRTTDLRGRGGVAQGNVHWTGNFDEIQDFEHDIRARFGGTGFLDLTPEEFALLHPSPASGKTGSSTDLDALAAYVSSLSSEHVPRSPQRNENGTMTTSGISGHSIFNSSGCASCHAGTQQTNSQLDSVTTHSLSSVGSLVRHPQQAWVSGHRLGEPLSGIDTPTLHGLHASRVFLHHGLATSLDKVFDFAGGTLLLASTAQLLTTGNPPGVGPVVDMAAQGGGGFERGMYGGSFVYIGEEAGAPTRPGIRFNAVDGGSGGPARLAIRYARQYAPGSAVLRVNGVEQTFTTLRQDPDNSWQVSGWRWYVANVALNAGATNTIELLRPDVSFADFMINAIVVANADDLAAAQPHRVVQTLTAGQRVDLISYLEQLDGRDDSGAPLPAPPTPSPQPPTLLSGPNDLTLAVGNRLRFAVVVGGTGPFSYEWRRDSTLVGSNNPIFEIASVTMADAGIYSVTVTNAVGQIVSPAAHVQVNPPLSVTTMTLPSATLGQAYSFLLSATGGVSQQTWTVDSGVLPPGLLLASTGEISGTATTAARAAFVVRVSDSSGSATRSLTLDARPQGGFVQDPDLILHYAFDEGSGTRIWDTAPSGNNHATDVATASWVADGQFGGAYGAPNPNSIFARFYPANQSDLDFDPLSDAFTISVWLRTTAADSYCTVFGKDGQPPEWPVQYRLWTVNPNTSLQPVTGSQYGPPLSTSSPALDDGQWHLLTLVNRFVSGSWRTFLYYDNGGAFTQFATGGGGRLTNLLRIGDTSFGGNPWVGQMDDFRIYRRALSAGEIADLYAPPTPTVTPSRTMTVSSTPTVTASATAPPALTQTPTVTQSPEPTLEGGCPTAPLPSCFEASQDTVKLKHSGNTRKLLIKSSHLASTTTAADFGNPLASGNTYRICLYDSSAGMPIFTGGISLSTSAACRGSSCWTAVGTKGFVFKDSESAQGGIRKMLLVGGEAGRGKLLIVGKGESLPFHGPYAGARYFAVDSLLTVQVWESSTDHCWQSTIGAADVKKNDETQFKGSRRAR